MSASLHIRLVTRSAGFLTESFDRDRSCPNAARSESLAVSVILEDLADEYAAVILSPLTKTDYSLPGKRVDRYRFASLAPFGDVFLTDLEFVARYRNRLSEVLPSSLVSLPEVEAAMSRFYTTRYAGELRIGIGLRMLRRFSTSLMLLKSMTF